MQPRVAVLDDERRMGQILGMVLRREGYAVEVYQQPRAFLEAMEEQGFDLLLTDLKMPQMDGVEVLRRVKAASPDTPVILMTAYAEVKTAIAAMREGAFDYVEKPFDNDACKALVRRALDVTRLARENRYLRAELRSRYALDHVITVSAAMRQVFELARRAARSRATVLIQGESGTGKELVARAIHYHSDRVGRPFVAINCKAFASGVLESELFGHEKGAFTGASAARPGVFERADGGTLFLDEIGEIDLDFQAKLLRALQEREVSRVGGARPRAVDARVVAATNRDLRREVEEGRFREDLYFRLAVIPIRLPPLRDRVEDILPIASALLTRACHDLGRRAMTLSDEARHRLTTWHWPGNVRELANVLERAAILADGDTITPDHLWLEASSEPPVDNALRPLVEVERDMIVRTLAAVDGNRRRAAEMLGIAERTLYDKIKRYDIDL